MYSERRWLLAIVMSVMLAVTMLFTPTSVMAAGGEEGGGDSNDEAIQFLNSDGSYSEAFVTEDGFIYENVNSDGTEMVKVVGYNGGDSVIDIPETINSLPVMSVCIDPRYPGVKGLDYDNVTTIKLPANLEYGNSGKLKHFDNLSTIEVAEDNQFYAAEDGILYKYVDDGFLKLAAYPAAKTDTEWVMPDNVAELITLPKSCPLEKITLSEALQSCGHSKFKKLENLESITVPEANEEYASVDGVLYDKDKTYLVYYPRNKKDSTLTIPETVTSVSYYAFYGGRDFETVAFTADPAPDLNADETDFWGLRDYYEEYECDFTYPEEAAGYSDFIAWLKGKNKVGIDCIVLNGQWCWNNDPDEVMVQVPLGARIVKRVECWDYYWGDDLGEQAYVKFSKNAEGQFDKDDPDETGIWYAKAFIEETDTHFAAEYGPIKLEVVDCETNENGQKHNELITVSPMSWEYSGEHVLVEAYTLFGEPKIEFRPYGDETAEWTETPPIDAGQYSYRITVSETEEYEGVLYISDEEVFIEITKAWNWFESFGCDDVVAGEEPQPYAEPLYGDPADVEFRYASEINWNYDYESGDEIMEPTYMDSYPTEPGDYFVIATVAGDKNYRELQDYCNFKVLSEEEAHAAQEEEAVRAAKAAINALPAVDELTLDDEDAVNEAKELFDALTDDQKDVFNQKLVKKLNNAVAKIAELKETTHEHDAVLQEAVPATCTAAGNEAYWYCAGCDTYFKDNNGEPDYDNEIAQNSWVINAKGHADPMAHTAAKEATCTEEGNREYWYCDQCEKYFSDAEGLTEIDPSDVVIPAGHTLKPVAAKDPTCTEDGNIACWQCEGCQEYFADAEGATALADSDRIRPAVDHDWGEPVYTWAEDYSSVTATRYCKNDSTHTDSDTASVSADPVIVESTCSEAGNATYTSDAFTNSAFVAQTIIVPLDKKAHTPKDAVEENFVDSTCQAEGSYDSVVRCDVCGAEISRETKKIEKKQHNWTEPTYEWTADGKACLATAVCQNGATHTASEAGKITSKVKTPATYTSMGTTTYTATFENEPFVQQTKDVQDIAKKEKLANPMKIKAVKKTVKVKPLKKKAVVVKGAVKFTKAAKGTKTYKGVGTNAKSKKALKINAKNGKITVKKNTKKGTYKMKVTVKAAGTNTGSTQYKPLSKTVTVTIVVQ